MKPCCQDAANLEAVSSTAIVLNGQRVDGASVTMPAQETMRRCLVCGCRHFEMTAAPLRMKLKGQATT